MIASLKKDVNEFINKNNKISNYVV